MRNHLISIAIILLVGFLSYWNSFQGEFVFDDFTGIVQKQAIHDLNNIPAIWNANRSRFLANFSFAVNYHLDGLNVEGYHLVNVSIHLVNSVLVYWFVCLISKGISSSRKHAAPFDSILPLFVALLFVSHPIQTQAVTYISQRTTSLAALWYLLSTVLWVSFIGAHHDAPLRRFGVLILSYLFAVCAFLTKEYAFTLPITAGLLLFFIGKKRFRLPVFVALAGFFLVAAVTFLIARTAVLQEPVSSIQGALSLPAYTQQTISRRDYLITQGPVLLRYLQLLVIPVNQNADHDVPLYQSLADPVVSGSLFLLAVLGAAALYFRKKQPLFSLGLLFFFVTIAPESSLIPISDVMMEHRLYLPSAGFFLAAAGGLSLFFRRFAVRPDLYRVFVIVLIAACTVLTFRRNGVWRNGLELWSDVVNKSPDKARSHFNFGGALISHGYRAEGIDELIIAQHLDPSYKEAVIAIFALLQKGQLP